LYTETQVSIDKNPYKFYTLTRHWEKAPNPYNLTTLYMED